MRTALITTTVNVPEVLRLYRKHGGSVRFFVAGDEKTPSETQAFCATLDNCVYLAPDQQTRWKCSGPIGFNSIQRRNIALLEALAWGADYIVSTDDDNLPIQSHRYFWDFEKLLSDPHGFHGLEIVGYNGWFDVGCLLAPDSPHRGFPHEIKNRSLWSARPVIGARIGAAAGICLGDPDVSAVTRIAKDPLAHGISELLRAGIVVSHDTRTVWNSQNTAFIRELAPAMMMLSGVQRYDDIMAALICKRVMKERDLRVHFGMPEVWQSRNEHNLVTDLKNEIFGMEHLLELSRELDDWHPSGAEPVAKVLRDFYQGTQVLPRITCEAALAFLDDCEEVL